MRSQRFVSQRRTAHIPMSNIFFKSECMKYLCEEHGVAEWTEKPTNIVSRLLTSNETYEIKQILSVPAAKWFAVEATFQWKGKKLIFSADICSRNISTNIITGDPREKREGKRRKLLDKKQKKFADKKRKKLLNKKKLFDCFVVIVFRIL